MADKLRELETLRSRVEELSKRKRELEQRLRHLPTDSLKAKLLENVKVGGKGVKFVENLCTLYHLVAMLSFARCLSIQFAS